MNAINIRKEEVKHKGSCNTCNKENEKVNVINSEDTCVEIRLCDDCIEEIKKKL